MAIAVMLKSLEKAYTGFLEFKPEFVLYIFPLFFPFYFTAPG